MKILILSSYSDEIADVNELTAPNKLAYATKHGYDFENINLPHKIEGNYVRWLEIIQNRLSHYEVVMTMGCDTLFMNQRIRIESQIGVGEVKYKPLPTKEGAGYTFGFEADARVIIANEHISWFPINNDVMIWPRGAHSDRVLLSLKRDSGTWLSYPWLWQAHLWDLIQTDNIVTEAIRLVEARHMNSTFQPYTIDAAGQARRYNGPSSWYLGDWIFHALDMPTPEMRIAVIQWALQFVGDATYAGLPKTITGCK